MSPNPAFSSTFTGQITFDSFWAHEPGTFNYLPEPWQPAARWCSRCWRLIPNGQRAYVYYGNNVNLCHKCHRKVHSRHWAEAKKITQPSS